MRPVKQTLRHDPDNGVWGDCHRAALATILDLPIEQVPHFYDKGIDGAPVAREWLAENGYAEAQIIFPSDDLQDVLHTMACLNPGVAYLLGGTSRNGTGHTVVCVGGEIAHDPSLDNSGIVGPMSDGLFWVSFILPRSMQVQPSEVAA